jgi:hypothetical protein
MYRYPKIKLGRRVLPPIRKSSDADNPIRYFQEFFANDKLIDFARIRFHSQTKKQFNGISPVNSRLVENKSNESYNVRANPDNRVIFTYSFEDDLYRDLNIEMDESVEFIKTKISTIKDDGHYSLTSINIAKSFVKSMHNELKGLIRKIKESIYFKRYTKISEPIVGLINFLETDYGVLPEKELNATGVIVGNGLQSTKGRLGTRFFKELIKFSHEGNYVFDPSINATKLLQDLTLLFDGKGKKIKGKIDFKLPPGAA